MTLKRRPTLCVSDFARAKKLHMDFGLTLSCASRENIACSYLNGGVPSPYPRHLPAEDAKVADSKPGFSGVTIAGDAESDAVVDHAFAHARSVGGKYVNKPEEGFETAIPAIIPVRMGTRGDWRIIPFSYLTNSKGCISPNEP
jgi:hypothetical protein